MTERFFSDIDMNTPCTDRFMACLSDLLLPLVVSCPACGRGGDYLRVDRPAWDDDDDYDGNDLYSQCIYFFQVQCDCGVCGPEERFVNRNDDDETPATLKELFTTAVNAAKAWNDTFGQNKRKETNPC